MTERIVVIAGLLALAVAQPACTKKEPPMGEILAAEQKNLEPNAVAIEKIAAQASKLPAPTGKVTLEGPPPVIVRMGVPSTGNAIFAFHQDLLDLTAYPAIPLRSAASSKLANDCWSLSRKKVFAGIKMDRRDPMLPEGDQPQLRTTIEMCKLLRYLIVINLTAFKGTDYIDKESFGAGKASGDALVFDLRTGKYLGGVPFKAESSKFTKSSPDSDLWNNFYESIRSALEPKMPGSHLQ